MGGLPQGWAITHPDSADREAIKALP